jgi:hypothetical protein
VASRVTADGSKVDSKMNHLNKKIGFSVLSGF